VGRCKVAVNLEMVDLRLAVTDDLPPGDLPVMLRCRLSSKHRDSTSSMAVYPDHVMCYGCQRAIRRRMEALAFLLKVPIPTPFATDQERRRWWAAFIQERASKYTVDRLDAYRERAAIDARRDPLPGALAMSYHQLLCTTRSTRVAWYWQRGLNAESIQDFVLGHDGTRFTIPFYSRFHELLTVRFRRDDYYGTTIWDAERDEDRELPKYSGMWRRNGLFLYPEWRVLEAGDTLVVCEGELDAVRCWQEGIPAVSVTNGAGNLKHLPRLLAGFDHIRRLYVASDMDLPGERGAEELLEAAQGNYEVVRLRWNPEWGKDVTELYLSGHKLEEAGYERG
jgi:hypothetical protein